MMMMPSFLVGCLLLAFALADPSATILYPSPKHTPTLNIGVDTLDISYVTPWKNVSLAVWCEKTASDGLFSFIELPNAPFTTNGTAIWHQICASFKSVISQYPTNCYLALQNYHDHTEHVSGGNFSLASSSGTPKTFSQSAKSTGSASLTAAAQTITGSQLPATQTGSAPTGVVTDSSESKGLSTGAIAGIAVGATIGGLIAVGALLFCLVRWRRRKVAEANNLHHVGLDEKVRQNAEGGKWQPFWRGKTAEMPAEEPVIELPAESQRVHSQPVAEMEGSSAGALTRS